MEACEIPREDMLPRPVARLKIEDKNCAFDCVKEAAVDLAEKYGANTRLLSWFDKKGQAHSQIDECCDEGQPSWVAYAEAHDANLTVDVNQEDYVFIFHQSRIAH
jgi:hypothetical protein